MGLGRANDFNTQMKSLGFSVKAKAILERGVLSELSLGKCAGQDRG